MLEVRQGHFPLLVASICGIGLHTHTCTPPPHGDGDWIIDRIETDGSQRTGEVSLEGDLSGDSHC